jgi:hypothetical protein
MQTRRALANKLDFLHQTHALNHPTGILSSLAHLIHRARQGSLTSLASVLSDS